MPLILRQLYRFNFLLDNKSSSVDLIKILFIPVCHGRCFELEKFKQCSTVFEYLVVGSPSPKWFEHTYSFLKNAVISLLLHNISFLFCLGDAYCCMVQCSSNCSFPFFKVKFETNKNIYYKLQKLTNQYQAIMSYVLL